VQSLDCLWGCVFDWVSHDNDTGHPVVDGDEHRRLPFRTQRLRPLFNFLYRHAELFHQWGVPQSHRASPNVALHTLPSDRLE
jgi:hypothetical protein